MKKKLAFIFVLVLCMALLCIGAAATAEDDVIKINTAGDLEKIGNNEDYPLDGDYVLTDNIYLDGGEKTSGRRLAATTTMPSPAPSTATGTR